MSTQTVIKFPIEMKEWQHYSPDLLERMFPGQNMAYIPRDLIIKYQNQLQKILLLWKENLEKNFEISFLISNVNVIQTPYIDFEKTNKQYVIFMLREQDLFFSVYIEDKLLKFILDHVFAVHEQTGKLSFSEMEKIFFNQFYLDTLFPVLSATKVLNSEACELDFGKKEKSKLINDLEGYFVFDYNLALSSMQETSSIMFAFSKKNYETFFERLSINKNIFPMIHLNRQAMEKIHTEVDAYLGEVQVNLGELQKMQVGDVLLLKKNLGEYVDVEIGNELQFKAQLGMKDNRIALKLVNMLEDCDEEKRDEIDETEKAQAVVEREVTIMNRFQSEPVFDEAFVSVREDSDTPVKDFDWEKV